MSSPSPAPLSGRLVVDLSSGIAGAYCTKLLADAGAEVVKVEPPEGDPLRRWSASGTPIADGDDGALFGFLVSTKRSVSTDPDADGDLDALRALLARADAVVWSSGTRLAERPSLAPAALRRDAPTSRSRPSPPSASRAPGATGRPPSSRSRPGPAASSASAAASPDRAPVHVGGQIGEWLTGTQAAIAHAGVVGRRRRPGELVDVSMLETLVLGLTYYPVTYFDMVGRPFRSGRSIVTPGVERDQRRPRRPRRRHRPAVARLLRAGRATPSGWRTGRSSPTAATSRPTIAAWMAERTTAEVLEVAGAFRIPHAPIGNGATIPATDHFEARGLDRHEPATAPSRRP